MGRRTSQQVRRGSIDGDHRRLRLAIDDQGSEINGSSVPDYLNERFVPFPRAIEWALSEFQRHASTDDVLNRQLSACLDVLTERFSELVDCADVQDVLALSKPVLALMRLRDNQRQSEMRFVAQVIGHVANIEVARIQAEAQSGTFGTKDGRQPEMVGLVSAVTAAVTERLGESAASAAESGADDDLEAA